MLRYFRYGPSKWRTYSQSMKINQCLNSFSEYDKIRLISSSPKRSLYCNFSNNNSFQAAGLSLQQFDDAQSQGIARLIEAYRVHGHKKADVNPLYKTSQKSDVEELRPENYGLDMNSNITLNGGTTISISDLISHLEHVFCGSISVETSQLEFSDEKEFICQSINQARYEEIDDKKKRNLAELLIKSQGIDHFINSKFKTVKRYGGEGAESAAAFSDEIFRFAAKDEIEQVIIGMPHRGRLNLLVGQLDLPPEVLFRKMKGLTEFPEEASSYSTGDVISHLTSSTDLVYDDNTVHVTMLPCPSHLEAVNSVAMGKCRGRQLTQTLGKHSTDEFPIDEKKALCFLMHGDAAFAGQGVVAECFNMSNLPHFSVGGTIHLIVNNQIGFTTPSHQGRSSRYSSDIGKIIGCPVIHVNGDHPEDVVKVANIAMEYRKKFKKDIIVDLICFRRWGHNEIDDPSFTQPIMYQEIEARHSVPDYYAQKLVESEVISSEEVSQWNEELQSKFNEHLKNTDSYIPPRTFLHEQWSSMKIPQSSEYTLWDTGYPVDNLAYIGVKSVEVPDSLEMHSRLVKMYADVRRNKMETGSPVDWATAEALAFGSLLQQDFSIRLCGQDVGRGTFSHRHAVVVCQDSEIIHVPLNHLSENQTSQIEVVNSLLSEEAVLGFEYGMSVENPNRLVIWEAQFGDFFNGAQIIVDTFVNSGEAKWLTQSGLVMLLPHGYDGMGPEHSSCRIERFLQGTNSKEDGIDGDDVNIHFCNPTTPAQYFHLLRRQMIRNYRKPLVVASPKTLLRLPAATSCLSEMGPGTHFRPVLPDPSIKDQSKLQKVIFCSGKHYYTLVEERDRLGLSATIAVIRVEELCPFPAHDIRQQVANLPDGISYKWAQEEPRNMGAWNFVSARFENILGIKLEYAGRPVLPTPAVGVGKVHKEQADQILIDTFK
ncbi:2-oxoadipate dehydrogenase complex component E1-like [Styela clava]